MKNKKEVVTIDGSIALRSECRYIKNNFYKIGDSKIEGSGQCYLVNGKYCRENTNYIVYDNGLSKYVRKSESLIHGIIDLEEDNETPIYGYFSKSEIYNVLVMLKNKSTRVVLHEEILIESYYREQLKDGKFYHIDLLQAKDFIYKTVTRDQRLRLPYDSRGIMEDNIKLYNKYNDSTPSEYINNHYKKLENLTFGFEFETINGNIPTRITSKLGLLPLRDGSIRGLEYVTIPLSGKSGLQTVMDVSKELKKRTLYDSSCSMHLHIGGVPRTKEFIIALYRVFINLEDELFKCFPMYKRYSYGLKNKEYTKPLPTLEILPFMDDSITEDNIDNNFNVLFKYFSMGQNYIGNFMSLDEVESHPSDPEGSHKWQISSRYHAQNFIPLLFGNKQTIEFRIHNATDDGDKMLNFLFLNAAIINYTIKNEKTILKSFKQSLNLNIDKIVYNIYKDSTLTYNLIEYFNGRRQYIRNNIHRGNVMSNEEDMNKSPIRWDKKSTQILNATKLKHNDLYNNIVLEGFIVDLQERNRPFINPINENG